jgi:spermidine synthase
LLKDRPVRFALAIGAVLLASHVSDIRFGRVLRQERNFYGVVRVTQDVAGQFRRMIHGNTNHGQQSLDPRRRGEPLTYYHRTGPVGQLFEILSARTGQTEVAVVGLGTGSLACYAEPSQRWKFFEIDPAVVKFARDARLFTYLEDCRAMSLEFRVGDARIRLRDEPAHRYELIVLDAFSSDAIPIHLLTREAIMLYRDKLAAGGLLAFHISNIYIDLPPVVAALAKNAGLIVRIRSDLDLTKEQIEEGKLGSTWAVMAASEQDLGTLAKDPRWKAPALRPDDAVWTDDFTDIVRHFIILRR